MRKTNTIIWRILCTVRNSVKRMFGSTYFYVLVFFTLLFWYIFTLNIKGYAADTGYGVVPYLLPHFYENGTFRVYGKLLLVLVTCAAPWLDRNKIFTIQRSGRMPWCIGQMLFLVVANVIFQCLMFVCQVITLLPYVAFSAGWGSVLYTIGEDRTKLSDYNGGGSVSQVILQNMTPFEAMWKQILLCILLGSLIGAVTFLINGLTGKNIAAILMVGIIFAADVMKTVDFYYGTALADKNPFNWMSLSDYISGTYDFGRNVMILLVLFLAMAVVCCICVKKRWIRTVE